MTEGGGGVILSQNCVTSFMNAPLWVLYISRISFHDKASISFVELGGGVGDVLV